MWTIVATAFVLGVLVLLGYDLFVAPFRRHRDEFRDTRTHRKRGESPHLEMRDEYERTHETGSPHLEGRNEFEHRNVGVA